MDQQALTCMCVSRAALGLLWRFCTKVRRDIESGRHKTLFLHQFGGPPTSCSLSELCNDKIRTSSVTWVLEYIGNVIMAFRGDDLSFVWVNEPTSEDPSSRQSRQCHHRRKALDLKVCKLVLLDDNQRGSIWAINWWSESEKHFMPSKIPNIRQPWCPWITYETGVDWFVSNFVNCPSLEPSA